MMRRIRYWKPGEQAVDGPQWARAWRAYEEVQAGLAVVEPAAQHALEVMEKIP
jgi:hypothetical protein